MKYIIIYTMPDGGTVGQVFETIDDAQRNAKYLAHGEGATPVDIYEATLISTIPVGNYSKLFPGIDDDLEDIMGGR